MSNATGRPGIRIYETSRHLVERLFALMFPDPTNAPCVSPGPKSFVNLIDGYVFLALLDRGAEAETPRGSGGWSAVLRGGPSLLDEVQRIAASVSDKLTLEETELLRSSVGVVVVQITGNAVDVGYYESLVELNKAWAKRHSGKSNTTEGSRHA